MGIVTQDASFCGAMSVEPGRNGSEPAASGRPARRTATEARSRPAHLSVVAVAALALLAAVTDGCRGRERDATDAFLAEHWRLPIPPQGPAPQGWAPITVSLRPGDCAVCHRPQFEQWRGSIHADAYSPGLHGQLLAWIGTDDATVASCHACHAPSSEQLPRVERGGVWVDNPAFEPDLQAGGVSCAACHVRGWRRYGPPRRDGSTDPAPPGTPHDGAIFSDAFQSSEFCAACHQFEEPAANGKPLENTLSEWRESPAAARGQTCQSCHMPDRAHLWRGIHDPETTRRGTALVWERQGHPAAPSFRVRLGLANVGAGHRLPTYVTPKIFLRLRFEDADGRPLAARERRIGRDVSFEAGEWREREDTRIEPGESETLEWRGPAPEGSRTVVGSVIVAPDHFYEGFFRDLIAETDSIAPQIPVLRQALRRATESPYVLYEKREELGTAAAR